MAESNLRIYQANEMIAHEGSFDKRLFILKSGTLLITRNKTLINEISQSGTIFGEMSLLLNGRRTASLKTKTKCEIYVLELSVSEIIQKHPSIAEKIMISLAEKINGADERNSKLIEEIALLKKTIPK